MNCQPAIHSWFKKAQKQGAAFLLVCRDNFDYGYYPIYCDTIEEARDEVERIQLARVSDLNDSIRASYDITKPFSEQNGCEWPPFQ